MTDIHARMRFSRIQTTATLADGRTMTSWNSYPRGCGKGEYDRVANAWFRAYRGARDLRVVGTPTADSVVEARGPAPYGQEAVRIFHARVVIDDATGFDVGVHRSTETAARALADEIGHQIERREDVAPLQEEERRALQRAVAEGFGIDLTDRGRSTPVAGIEPGRLAEIGAICDATYRIVVGRLED